MASYRGLSGGSRSDLTANPPSWVWNNPLPLEEPTAYPNIDTSFCYRIGRKLLQWENICFFIIQLSQMSWEPQVNWRQFSQRSFYQWGANCVAGHLCGMALLSRENKLLATRRKLLAATHAGKLLCSCAHGKISYQQGLALLWGKMAMFQKAPGRKNWLQQPQQELSSTWKKTSPSELGHS